MDKVTAKLEKAAATHGYIDALRDLLKVIQPTDTPSTVLKKIDRLRAAKEKELA